MTTRPRQYAAQPPPSSAGSFGRAAHISVAVLAELPVIAHGLGVLVRRTGFFEVVATTTDLDRVLELVSNGAVRVVVISASTRTIGFTRRAVEAIQHASPEAGRPVGTVCVVPGAEVYSAETVGLEASAMLHSADGVDGLARSVFDARLAGRRVRSGPRVCRTDATPPRDGQDRPALTPRELEVLQGMADGLSSKHIAEDLGVSVHTVRTHVQRLLAKLGVHSRLRATAVALQEGLVEQRSISRLAGRDASAPDVGRTVGTAG